MKGYRSRGDRHGRPYVCVPVFHAARRGSPLIRLLAIPFLLVLLSCGETPAVVPPGPTSGPPLTVEPYPPPEAWPTWTPNPYPIIWPTAVPWTPSPPPTEAPVIVLGAEWAPEAERQVYVSTTVVVAKVGDGPGEVGYQPHGEEIPTVADQFAVDVHGNIYILDRVNQRVVQFDPQGRFTQNIPYTDIGYPELLAVDAEGRVYLYDSEVAVKSYDTGGRPLQTYPVPSWFWNRQILAMRVDEQGTLWVEGQGSTPNAPIIEDQPYGVAVVPLGNSAEVFGEERQKAMAVPGHLLDSGGTAITYAPFSNSYLYDLQGRPIYELADQRGLLAVDQWGFWYLVGYDPVDSRMYMRLHKLARDGKEIAAFDLPLGPTLVDANGTAYCLVFDRQTQTNYRVIRWRQK